jgi:hypothetical protein
MMEAVVVDTNVAVVANGKADHVNNSCVKKCVASLKKIVDGSCLLSVDDDNRIYKEYERNLSPSGEPGVGDEFFKWFNDNQWNYEYIEKVHITPRDDDYTDFEEFPRGNNLKGFHSKDRKFVAVALASERKPTILNASDRVWWEYREALEACGCKIKFLCPEIMR